MPLAAICANFRCHQISRLLPRDICLDEPPPCASISHVDALFHAFAIDVAACFSGSQYRCQLEFPQFHCYVIYHAAAKKRQ